MNEISVSRVADKELEFEYIDTFRHLWAHCPIFNASTIHFRTYQIVRTIQDV